MRRFAPLALSILLLATPAGAQQFLYLWNGPAFSTTSGTVSPGSSVSGSLVLQGPVENLPFGDVTPVAFSFSAGPVTISDATPLHPLTRIRIQTDATGTIIDTEIQLVEEIDTGSGTTFADVICVADCPASGPNDYVIDRNALAILIGEGEVPVVGSFWLAPVAIDAAPTLSAPAQFGLVGALVLAAAQRRRAGERPR
ncbi:MAG: hypothetical protein AAF430_21580 [Myxococcota bacterium]